MINNECAPVCLHAVQPRCPNCDTEVWGMAVVDFSHGTVMCVQCRKCSKPMTRSEYQAALTATRLSKKRG